jgi:mono/diheme cytochrome c family protein
VKVLAPVTALAVVLVALAGCGGGKTKARAETAAPASSASSPRGAAVFAKARCGECHSLAAAKATGTIGPSLDGRQFTAKQLVRQVRRGGRGMPAFKSTLSGAEIDAVAHYVVSSSSAKLAKPKSFKPDGTTLAQCENKGDALCWRQAFGNLSAKEGPKVALETFEKDLSNPVVEAGCHPMAHTIGAAALLYYKGDVGKAFAAGNAACGSGYYHGLLEWKLAGVSSKNVASVARTVCNAPEIRANGFIYYQCNHGLGHGLMLYTLYDLPGALKLCHQLATNFDQISCTGGVFMENQQSSYGLTSEWLRKDNLLYPCTIVAEVDKLYCYLLVTSQILPRVAYDWKKTADWCRKSDANFVGICFQSYGRDASGVAREDPAKIRGFCAQAGSGERECLFGAVRDILNNNSTDLRGRELCESVAKANRAYCFYGIGSILGSVHGTAAERRTACAQFAGPRDVADCIKGADSAATG